MIIPGAGEVEVVDDNLASQEVFQVSLDFPDSQVVLQVAFQEVFREEAQANFRRQHHRHQALHHKWRHFNNKNSLAVVE